MNMQEDTKNGIKWFGKYLESEAVNSDGRKIIVKGVDLRLNKILCQTVSAGLYEVYIMDYKLILKELKDISYDDLKVINDMTTHLEPYPNGHILSRELYLLVEEIDFLRSKGYAIGIPKEYYITELELKEESK